MNKELELIRRETYALWEEYGVRVNLINEAAERMAAEIEQLKEEVNETQTVYYSVLKDNTRLKAELEKRPEIIRCGECDNLIINDDGKYCGIAIDAKRTCNDFCSRGQRRESEVGK